MATGDTSQPPRSCTEEDCQCGADKFIFSQTNESRFWKSCPLQPAIAINGECMHLAEEVRMDIGMDALDDGEREQQNLCTVFFRTALSTTACTSTYESEFGASNFCAKGTMALKNCIVPDRRMGGLGQHPPRRG